MRTLVQNQVASASNKNLTLWVQHMAELCQPDSVYWCDGSEEERVALTNQAVQQKEVELLDQRRYPGCLYARSKENDVARVESLTFICTRNKEDAGPNNHWMAPPEAIQKLTKIYSGAMKGRVMYVVPFLMGVPGSAFSKVGVQLTDSLYVVLNMRIMTRMGQVALEELGNSPYFTRCLHSKADLDDKKRFICHFPETNTIWSVGTNYGGNVLMGKKCLALRIGSWLGRHEGWLAEHMLIMGIEDPKGEVHFIAAAFPSQCGKTNLAMLLPPKAMPGYKVWTVGDDIAWLRIGEDGRLWASNPENGFFGVAPGTNSKTNPAALEAIRQNTIYTNVVKTADGGVWWEGLDGDPPKDALDWKGRPWNAQSGMLGAHPNSRFTAPISQCPTLWPDWDNPKGVPISAIIFGGRRARLDPLIYESLDWDHGVFMGATMASETTAAATGQVGIVRRDPMAMLPFCGYHMGEYFDHWIKMGSRLKKAPKIFHVNWFRKNGAGQWVWPGFGENLRVLKWVIDRVEGRVGARESVVGWLPRAQDLELSGLSIGPEDVLRELLTVDPADWVDELAEVERFFRQFDPRLPKEIWTQHQRIKSRVEEKLAQLRKEKAMQITEHALSQHPFFKGVHEWYLEQLTRYAREEAFEDGEYLICEGMEANEFYLLTEGQVDIGVTSEDKKFHPVQTLRANDIVGWSWLLEPHTWHFDAVAKGPVKALVLDGKYLRTKCLEDPALGYELVKRLSGFMVQRLTALRARLAST